MMCEGGQSARALEPARAPSQNVDAPLRHDSADENIALPSSSSNMPPLTLMCASAARPPAIFDFGASCEMARQQAYSRMQAMMFHGDQVVLERFYLPLLPGGEIPLFVLKSLCSVVNTIFDDQADCAWLRLSSQHAWPGRGRSALGLRSN